MSLIRIVNLLQTTLFLLFCIVGFVFISVDVYWYYLLDDAGRWDTIIRHHWTYELIWYLDCFTFLFMYLWLAVKLLRLACNAKYVWEIFKKYVLIKVVGLFRSYLNFDMLFKVAVVVVGFLIFKHAMGYDFDIPRLMIISDIRPMANIYYDIYGVLQWLHNFIL
jgi:hypothetical protein